MSTTEKQKQYMREYAINNREKIKQNHYVWVSNNENRHEAEMTADELRQIMRDLKLRQIDLANIACVNIVTLSKWLKGTNKMTPGVARLLRIVHRNRDLVKQILPS